MLVISLRCLNVDGLAAGLTQFDSLRSGFYVQEYTGCVIPSFQLRIPCTLSSSRLFSALKLKDLTTSKSRIYFMQGQNFSAGSFVLKTDAVAEHLFIVVIQYECPECLLKNINVTGQTLTILKQSMKLKCRMYLKSFTLLISLPEPGTWLSALRCIVCLFIMTFLCSKLIALECSVTFCTFFDRPDTELSYRREST